MRDGLIIRFVHYKTGEIIRSIGNAESKEYRNLIFENGNVAKKCVKIDLHLYICIDVRYIHPYELGNSTTTIGINVKPYCKYRQSIKERISRFLSGEKFNYVGIN